MEGSVIHTIQPESDSESDDSYSSDEILSSNVGVRYLPIPVTDDVRLLDHTRATHYERFQKKYFNPPTYTKGIVIDSHNYVQGTDFNSSNFVVKFNHEDTSGTTTVSTAYGIFRNVIGFKIMNAQLRNIPYNVNSTNNVIPYKVGVNECTVTINPGSYSVSELALVFQTSSASTNSHHVTYAGTSAGTFTVTYLPPKTTGTHSSASHKGAIFQLVHSASEVTIQWSQDNVSRGAAKLLGFLPTDITTSPSTGPARTTYSNKSPDLSHHHVDLVIPEIPAITCKRNSAGKEIISRFPLQVNRGEYQYYFDTDSKHHYQNFFYPITLHQLTIQLYAENNEFYDSQATDNSFEFELTMLRHDHE